MSIHRLTTKLKAYVDRIARRIVYTQAGRTDKIIKEWYGVTTSVDGTFTFNFAEAGFTEILHCDPRAIYNTNNTNEQSIATLNTVTRTSCRGHVVHAASNGFRLQAGATVMVKVIGT